LNANAKMPTIDGYVDAITRRQNRMDFYPWVETQKFK